MDNYLMMSRVQVTFLLVTTLLAFVLFVPTAVLLLAPVFVILVIKIMLLLVLILEAIIHTLIRK